MVNGDDASSMGGSIMQVANDDDESVMQMAEDDASSMGGSVMQMVRDEDGSSHMSSHASLGLA